LLAILEGTFFAILVVYTCAVIALPLSDRLLPRQHLLLRALAALLIAATMLTLIFHALLPFSAFTRVGVGALLLLSLAGARFAGLDHAAAAHVLARDVKTVARGLVQIQSWPARIFGGVVVLLLSVTALRSLMLPTIGWDSITYHYVKAGMWVQSGGPITLDAPGGWSLYRSFLGGGEIFAAWAMLPFGNDLLVGAVDVIWWACCGLAIAALGREFGLRVRHRDIVAVYAIFLPVAWDAVEWGYVDLANTGFLLTGLVFAIRALRHREPESLLLCLLAVGLASGVKLTAVPFAAATVVALLWSVIAHADNRARRIRMFGVGCMAGLLIVTPWLVSNLMDTGFPLRMPMTVAGLQLGAENAAFTWYQDRVLSAYTLRAEFDALAKLFPLPNVNESHLSALTLPAFLLAPVGFFQLFRTRRDLRGGLLLTLALCGAILMAFYHSSFSFSRLEFTWVNARFLMPVAYVALPLAMAALPKQGRPRDVFGWALVAASFVHFGFFAPMRFTLPSAELIAIGGLVGIGCAAGAAFALHSWLVRKVLPPSVAIVVLIACLMAGATGLSQLRDLDQRYLLLANRNVSADVFRYWWQAAYLVEADGAPARVALTAGPRQDADNWLMYYFLGRNLQNTLHYIPISADGSIIPFGPKLMRQTHGDYAAWISRIEESEITHVFSFFPTSVELGWMDARPDRFTRLVGDAEYWALFQVRATTGIE
jgi:hypothetical protein